MINVNILNIFRLAAKLLMFVASLFLLPLIVQLLTVIFHFCGNEEILRYLLIISYTLQAFSLIPAIIIDRKVNKSYKSAQPNDSNCSNASLTTSVNSRLTPTSDSGEKKREISSWHDFVLQARNSICNENFYTIEPLPPIAPTASYATRQRAISEHFPTRQPSIFKHRKNIRDVMRRAKNDFPKKPIPEIQLNPPLPKNIPNQILDDVQLFDFYYKNLNSVYFTGSSPDIKQDNKPDQGGEIKSDVTISRIDNLLPG